MTVFPFAADNFELPHQLVLVVGALVLSYGACDAPRALVLALGLVVGAAVLTTVTSQSPAFSTPGLIALLAVAAFGLVSDGLSWRPVLWTTWPVALWALAQGLGLDPVSWSDAARWCGGVRPFSTLGHPTQLGMWMALVCVLAVDDAFTRKSMPMALTALLAGVTCGVTLSRAGWLALAVGLLAWWWQRRRDVQVSGRALAFVAAGVAVLVLVARGPAVLERVTHFFVAPTRVHLWGTSWAGFREHPWFGWGFDAFALVDQQLRHPEAWRYEWGGTAGHAHSLIAQVLATQGVVGLVMLLAVGGIVLRSWRASPPRAEGAVVIALAAASMVTFSGVAVAALGGCALAQSLRGPRVRLPSWLPIPLLGVAAVTLLMMGASVAARVAPLQTFAQRLEPWNAQWPALRGEALERDGRLAEAGVAYERARTLTPLAVFGANVGRVASKQGDALGSRAAFERARRLAPLDGRIALDAAEASLRLRELELAEGTLTSLVTLYPSDGPAWLALARLRLQTHRVVEARAALETSLAADWRDWPEGVGLARTLLTQLLSQTGDPQLAEQIARGPEVFALPGDACGAPRLLHR
ncbi:MAG: O-antigen ligase family protein [Archangium sp.]|nr:O-antigen ligase family protein [Archangium sp.]